MAVMMPESDTLPFTFPFFPPLRTGAWDGSGLTVPRIRNEQQFLRPLELLPAVQRNERRRCVQDLQLRTFRPHPHSRGCWASSRASLWGWALYREYFSDQFHWEWVRRFTAESQGKDETRGSRVCILDVR